MLKVISYFFFILIIMISIRCTSQKKNMQRVTQLLETRQKAYNTLDYTMMMTTYHPEYMERGTDFEAKQFYFKRIFEPDQQYKFKFSNIRITKKKNYYYVRYDFVLEKNMDHAQRGFSMNNRDQDMILIEYQTKLVEYGHR